FFLMTLHPRTSTLFPYTTLFRSLSGIGVALIAVFWAFDGWVYITWVAGEVKDPQRNLPRSLTMGLVLVGVIYLTINAVYLYALRSEEHTSELQSPYDLVCRLLLE